MDPISSLVMKQARTWLDSGSSTEGLGNDPAAPIDPTKLLPIPLPQLPDPNGATGAAKLPQPDSLIVKSIAVTPSPILLDQAAGSMSQALHAAAIFNDGTSRDVTAYADWSSSAPGVAIAYQTTGPSGATMVVAKAVGPGKGTITATVAGITGAAPVEVSSAAGAKGAIAKVPWWGWMVAAGVVVGGVVLVATRRRKGRN